MKKVFFLTALAALALSSCSSDETVQAPVLQDGAIAFDIYTARAVSRNADLLAGDKQSITTEVLKASTEGFGVYAYETGAQKFKSYLAGNTYPQYMFNQKVTWVSENPTAALTDLTGAYYTAGDWKYTPVKYWPNDDSYVTFQAYAPWKASTENVLFDVKYNGVAIRYNVYESYDLLWGENVADAQKCCFEDQRKPGIADKTKFHFNHALSKVDFSISYNADDMDCITPDGKLDENTEIVIRSIKLLGTLPSQGVVSLYDGSWTVEKVSENLFEYDTDFFGYVNAVGNSNLTITGSTNNPQKVGDYIAGARPGVLTHDVNRLYANESVMLIPAQTDAKLEISYDVVTKDANGFKGHTKNITIVSDNIPTYWGNTHQDATLPDSDPESGAGDGKGVFHFEAGKWTTINIHLGMTSVKLDADVKAWDQSESGSIDMPANTDEISSGGGTLSLYGVTPSYKDEDWGSEMGVDPSTVTVKYYDKVNPSMMGTAAPSSTTPGTFYIQTGAKIADAKLWYKGINGWVIQDRFAYEVLKENGAASLSDEGEEEGIDEGELAELQKIVDLLAFPHIFVLNEDGRFVDKSREVQSLYFCPLVYCHYDSSFYLCHWVTVYDALGLPTFFYRGAGSIPDVLVSPQQYYVCNHEAPSPDNEDLAELFELADKDWICRIGEKFYTYNAEGQLQEKILDTFHYDPSVPQKDFAWDTYATLATKYGIPEYMDIYSSSILVDGYLYWIERE